MNRKQQSHLELALTETRDWTDDFISRIAHRSGLSKRTVREWYLDELDVSCVVCFCFMCLVVFF